MIRIPQNGDRIRLVSMDDDPDPIQPGQLGTITHVNLIGSGPKQWMQIDVDWDHGRQLMLACPPDRFEVISS
ncbi:MAG: DUF4314 domain-containing protein [Planctomycetota bacterium]